MDSRKFLLASLVFCSLAFLATASFAAQEAAETTMRMVIDARELPRKLLTAVVTIPISAEDADRQIAIWYPKWVPGSHGPGGPIANVAGFSISDGKGHTLEWTRSPGEVYRLLVDVPAGVESLVVKLRYIANQPTTNSMGHDVFGTAMLGIISPGAVLVYQEGADIDETMIESQLILPLDWKASTALPLKSNDDSGAMINYAATTLQTFVDSPIMCGRHQKIYGLNDASQKDQIVPHHLHVFSEVESAIELNGEVLDRLKKMVTQTARLMGSSPFDRFEILLALSNQLPANGLEHARSTLNVLAIDSVASPTSLKGWSRLLIPHEYLHAWCGKYRRPDAMVTSDFHTAMGTDLLWVYEGLTQFLGELVEARCGLMSHDQFRDRICVELRNASLQQNRQWRPLVDTAAASHILRSGSDAWPKLRGGQDYYMEGMLFWLEADAVLRTKTEGRKSIDDFCQRFFQADGTQATALGNRPKPFTRAEVLQELTALCDHDWDGMIRRRIESPQQTFDMQVAELLGYRMTLSKDRPSIHKSTFRLPAGDDHYDSIGAIFSSDGTVRDILLESPADRAKLVPGMKVLGINGRTFNSARLKQAVIDSARASAIEFIVSDGDFIRNVELQYHDGLKYLTLIRDEARPDLLEAILEPR